VLTAQPARPPLGGSLAYPASQFNKMPTVGLVPVPWPVSFVCVVKLLSPVCCAPVCATWASVKPATMEVVWQLFSAILLAHLLTCLLAYLLTAFATTKWQAQKCVAAALNAGCLTGLPCPALLQKGLEEALSHMCVGERAAFVLPATAMRLVVPAPAGTGAAAAAILLPPPPPKALQLEAEVHLLSVVQVGAGGAVTIRR
jgi:hypothetical protein